MPVHTRPSAVIEKSVTSHARRRFWMRITDASLERRHLVHESQRLELVEALTDDGCDEGRVAFGADDEPRKWIRCTVAGIDRRRNVVVDAKLTRLQRFR